MRSSCLRHWVPGAPQPPRSSPPETDRARPGATCRSWQGRWRAEPSFFGVPLVLTRNDGDVYAILVTRLGHGLYVLLADVVHEQGTADLVAAVGEPRVVREPHDALFGLINDLSGMAA